MAGILLGGAGAGRRLRRHQPVRRAASAEAVLRRDQRVSCTTWHLCLPGKVWPSYRRGESSRLPSCWAPRVPALGIYPTVESLLAQGVLVLLLLVACLDLSHRAPRRHRAGSPPPEPLRREPPLAIPPPLPPEASRELLRSLERMEADLSEMRSEVERMKANLTEAPESRAQQELSGVHHRRSVRCVIPAGAGRRSRSFGSMAGLASSAADRDREVFEDNALLRQALETAGGAGPGGGRGRLAPLCAGGGTAGRRWRTRTGGPDW